MSLYTDYLMHHGIKGQKWGVRRFQNKDGSLTQQGKLRYNVNGKAASITRNMSNKYGPFNRQEVQFDVVKSRGRLTDSEARECVRLANKLFDESARREPSITKDVVDAVSSSGANMYGMNYRLKQPTSLAAKIGADAKEKSLDFAEAASGIKDTVRYTSLSSNNNFVSNYNKIKTKLEDRGYTETRCKNFFEKYRNGEVQHKAVQCTFETKDGFEFELQFQTPQSQAAKELKIPLYEERRKSGLSEARKAYLEQEMHNLAEEVPYPKDIETIKTHKR